MTNLNEALHSTFAPDQARALIALAEAHIRRDLAAWLLDAIRPIGGELRAQLAQAEAVAEVARADYAKAREAAAQADREYSESLGGGMNPPPGQAEKKHKAHQALAVAQGVAQDAGSRVSEIQSRLTHFARIEETLAGVTVPNAYDVQTIIRGVLASAPRLVGESSPAGRPSGGVIVSNTAPDGGPVASPRSLRS